MFHGWDMSFIIAWNLLVKRFPISSLKMRHFVIINNSFKLFFIRFFKAWMFLLFKRLNWTVKYFSIRSIFKYFLIWAGRVCNIREMQFLHLSARHSLYYILQFDINKFLLCWTVLSVKSVYCLWWDLHASTWLEIQAYWIICKVYLRLKIACSILYNRRRHFRIRFELSRRKVMLWIDT